MTHLISEVILLEFNILLEDQWDFRIVKKQYKSKYKFDELLNMLAYTYYNVNQQETNNVF